MDNVRRCVLAATWLLVLFAAAALLMAYAPSLSGGFVFDDTVHLRELEKLTANPGLGALWEVVCSSQSGPLGRPLAMLSFALQGLWTGMAPLPLRLGNLLVHLLAGGAAFFLTREILSGLAAPAQHDNRVPTLAAFVAGAWLLHPINLTSVAYIVQRMNSLAALFMLLALLAYARERSRQQARPGRWVRTALLISLLWACALLSKESALLLPVYLAVIEIFAYRFRAAERRDAIVARSVVATVVAGGALLVLGALIADSQLVLGGYGGRPFTWQQRLLTEPRVLIWYLWMIVAPNIRALSIYHDDLTISTSLLHPASTLPSMLLVTGLLASALLLHRRAPWYGFGVLWFFGGHMLESTIFPLELVFEHRNYLPSLGVLLTIGQGLSLLGHRLKLQPRLAAGAGAAILVMLGGITHLRAYHWAGTPEAVLMDALNHPQSARANLAAGNAYAALAALRKDEGSQRELFRQSDQHYRRAAEIEPESANAYFGWIIAYYDVGLEPPHAICEQAAARLAAGRLDATSINGLHALTLCMTEGTCRLSEADYLQVMMAALRNPRMDDGSASKVLRDLAHYASEKGDRESAIELARQAIGLDPEQFYARLELVYFLASAGKRQEALQALAELERTDKLGRLKLYADQWRRRLDTHTASR